MKRLALASASLFALSAAAVAAEPPGMLSGADVDWATIGTNLIPPSALKAGTGGVFDVRSYGGKCDGVTDDYAAFLAAESAAQSAGGGVVLVPATGHSCLVSHGFTLANGVGLAGVGTSLFAGTNAALTLWTSAGSWLQSTDTVNPTVRLVGHGSSVVGFNFIRAQPIPSNTPGVAYTPTTYPFEIVDEADFSTISNVKIVAAYNGVQLNYTAGSGGGTYVHIDHLGIDAMHTAFQTINDNDTTRGGDIHARSVFYAGNSNLVTYREAHAIGWDMGYTDNMTLDGFECFQTKVCITATNGTVFGNTHSGFNLQLDKLLCGQVIQCIVASGSTVFTGQINSLTAQSDDTATAELFDLSSDGADLSIGNLSVPFGGGALVTLGGGATGSLKIGNLSLGANAAGVTTYGYSANAANQAAFAVLAGAHLAIANKRVIRPSTAGVFIGGVGADNVEMPTYCWTPFATFEQAIVSGTGSTAPFTTDNYQSSGHFGNFLQVRLYAQPDITTSQAGTLTLSAVNFATDMYGSPIALTAATNSTGFTGLLDTNWKEVADAGNVVGRIQGNAPVGSAYSFGDLTFCGR